MIISLHIKNIALIQELNLELKKGLNILSGETGAGKSIIIDSLNFVLGDRADRSLIRFGEKEARVEVVFDSINQEARKALAEYGIENDDDVIVINRMMNEDRSECRINGRIVNLSTLRAVVGQLVDVHSQNEHQSLLKTSTQLNILDSFSSKIAEIKEDYHATLQMYYKIQAKLEQYSTAEERSRTIDLLTYQINEIEKNMPDEGEEEALINGRKRYYNFQKIYDALNGAYEKLYGGGYESALNLISKANMELESIEDCDNTLSDICDRLESAKIEIEDIAYSLKDKLSENIENIDIDYIEKRLENIRLLKKKYGNSIEEIAAFLNNAKEKADMLINAENSLVQLNKEIDIVSQKLIAQAKLLHEERQKGAAILSKSILAHLNDLGMKNTVFEINLDFPDTDEGILNNLTLNGADKVEFLLSPNKGEPVKPLAKIASGGEMARFMLSLKNVIADIDNIGTLVFDEIDSGISGKIASEVAKKLYNIAKNRQVIAVTHLPQLAAMADYNFLIEKQEIGEKTLTKLKLLNENETYEELMRLAGASSGSQTGLSHAKELKRQATEYKCSL